LSEEASWSTGKNSARTISCSFQKHYRKIRMTLQFLLSNEAKWSAKNFKINKL
jgi:hypothetical protein